MNDRALVLFDDRVARDWRPFSLTRPVGELLYGAATLRARAEHALEATCHGYITAPWLRSFDEPWAPPVLEDHAETESQTTLLLSSRFAAEPTSLPDEAALLVCDGEVVGCCLPREEAGRLSEDFLLDPDDHAPDLPRHPVPGTLLGRIWDLVAGNGDRIRRDLEGADHAAIARDVHHLGPGPVSVGENVHIAPGVVLDTANGPIRLDDGVTVEPFTRLAGPAYIGPETTLLGGRFDAVSIGPVCKVHGEVEETVILGYSNKAHDGFLGHAYLGLWVNLGALTTNSDLKNNYGPVRVWTPDGEVDTGRQKVGCFLGDHVKTAIGTMLNTGTVVGAGSNLFGGMPPKYVPPFSWGEPDRVYELARFLETAETVMGRREVALTTAQEDLLRAAWDHARAGD